MQNNFSDNDRYLFLYKYDCDVCGQNGWNALHHILGRVSSSILNASTIHNIKCHLENGKLSQFDVRKKLLNKTLKYLKENDYVLTKKDKEFMNKYKNYYE